MNNKYYKIIVIVLNIIGVFSLIYFAIPYIIHDTNIPNPNSMISSENWDLSGFTLLIGFIPLLCANILLYSLIKLKNKNIKLLFFLPSLICLILSIHYIIISIDNDKDVVIPKKIISINCKLNNKEYKYTIFDDNNEFSLAMDEKDKIDLSVIDYSTKDTIINSIKEYYENKNGECKLE